MPEPADDPRRDEDPAGVGEDARRRGSLGEEAVHAPRQHATELVMEQRGHADRSGGEREAADHRPPSPVREREERSRGGADDEEGERLQQVGANEAAGRAWEARPAAAGDTRRTPTFDASPSRAGSTVSRNEPTALAA